MEEPAAFRRQPVLCTAQLPELPRLGVPQLDTTTTALLWRIPVVNPEGRTSFSDSSKSWYR